MGGTKENIKNIYEKSKNRTLFGFESENFGQPIKKCDIEIKDIRYLRTKFARIREYCCRNTKSKKSCLEYFIVIPTKPCFGEAMLCYFVSKGKFDHSFYKTSQVRGYTRECFKNQMKKLLPKQAKTDFVNKLSNEDLNDFNLGNVKSDSFYRKIRSESINAADFSKDDIKA